MKKEVKEFCKQFNLTEKQFLGQEKIEGDFNLGYYSHPLPAGFNPTVGGYFDMGSYNSHPLPAGFNPTVGGYFNMNSKYKVKTKPYTQRLLSWQDGKYVMVDGMFTEVLHRRGNVYKVKSLGKAKEFYLVSNKEETFFAHGDTLPKAKEDLHFKIISETLKKEPILKDTVITMQYYRIVTGACEVGCKDFISKHKLKDKYKASELLPLLEKHGAYGVEKFKQLVKW